MKTGILVCGLNGSGKSTLGRALAHALGFAFLDNEDLFFPKTDPHYPFASPRSHAEAVRILTDAVALHPYFVLASVRSDYGKAMMDRYRCAVWVDAPGEIRLARVRQRSYQRFGSRMLPGGDLYEAESAFLAMVAARPESYVSQWIQALRCPVLRVDGTRPVAENIARILPQLPV